MNPKRRGAIEADLFKNIESVDQDNPTGIFRNLISGIARSIESLWVKSSSEFDQSFLRTASGSNLDDIARREGLVRKGGAPAGSATSQILYVKTGVFGDLSGGNDIFIPDGTTISSPDGRYVVKITTNALRSNNGVTLKASKSEQAVPVVSISDFNNEVIPVGRLTVFNGAVKNIKTRNVESLQSTNRESDSNLRHRIELKKRSQNNSSNVDAIRLGILSLLEVSDVRIIPFVYGPGSLDILAVGSNGLLSGQALDNIKDIVYSISSTTNVKVRSVKTVPLKIIITGRESDRSIVNRVFNEYIDSLTINQPFSFSEFRFRTGVNIGWGYAEIEGERSEKEIISPGQESIFIPDSSDGFPVRLGV